MVVMKAGHIDGSCAVGSVWNLAGWLRGYYKRGQISEGSLKAMSKCVHSSINKYQQEGRTPQPPLPCCRAADAQRLPQRRAAEPYAHSNACAAAAAGPRWLTPPAVAGRPAPRRSCSSGGWWAAARPRRHAPGGPGSASSAPARRGRGGGVTRGHDAGATVLAAGSLRKPRPAIGLSPPLQGPTPLQACPWHQTAPWADCGRRSRCSAPRRGA